MPYANIFSKILKDWNIYYAGRILSNLTLKATAVGSLPHKDAKEAIGLIFDTFKEIPFWPQLANVDRHEDMTVQYIQGIPGIIYDEKNCKYCYDAQSDKFFEELEEFFMDYEAIVNEKDFTNLDKYQHRIQVRFLCIWRNSNRDIIAMQNVT